MCSCQTDKQDGTFDDHAKTLAGGQRTVVVQIEFSLGRFFSRPAYLEKSFTHLRSLPCGVNHVPSIYTVCPMDEPVQRRINLITHFTDALGPASGVNSRQDAWFDVFRGDGIGLQNSYYQTLGWFCSCRVAPGRYLPGALARSGRGHFDHPAPPLTWLVVTAPRSVS